MSSETIARQIPPVRIVVLASDAGGHLQAILDAAKDPEYGVKVVAVGSDRAGNHALKRAGAAGLPAFVRKTADYPTRRDWDVALTEAVTPYRPFFVVSAGFMKILGPRFLASFPVINIHPTLLPAFPGNHAVRQTLAHGTKVTGCTVHFADEGIDTGPIIAQAAVLVHPDDTESTLHERIKVVEMDLLVRVIRRMARGWRVQGRTVVLPD